MNAFNEMLKCFGAELAKDAPVSYAMYFRDIDSIEYLTGDETTVSKWIDPLLTLIVSSDRKRVVGFRLNGFERRFRSHLKYILDLQDSDFLPLVSVMQEAVRLAGDDLLLNPDRRMAYKTALDLAVTSGVTVNDLPHNLPA